MHHRTLLQLAPALLLALAILVASAIAAFGAAAKWPLVAAPSVLVLGLAAVALLDRSAGRAAPVASLAFVGGAILVASSIVGARDPTQLAAMIPIFGCAGLPIVLRSGRCAGGRS